VSLDSAGVASYTFHFAGTANFDWQPEDLPVLDADDWLHIASLACVVRPGSEVLLDWARTCRAGMSYDINVRPTVITDPEVYWEEVQPWLRVVGEHRGVVKASDADVAFLAKSDGDGAEPVDVLAGWVEQYGLRLGVLTLGAGGALAVEPNGRRTAVPGFPTEVVDTVGAGDTFMAGFLDGYIGRGQDVEASLARGSAAASIAPEADQAGAPSWRPAQGEDWIALARRDDYLWTSRRQLANEIGLGVLVGDDEIDLGHGGEGAERVPAEFPGDDRDDSPAGGLQHRSFGCRLLRVRGGQTLAARQAVYPDNGQIRAQSLQAPAGPGVNGCRGESADRPGESHDAQVVAVGQQLGGR
jgi:sugar/nucleoside kinase (ribokinase family)